jgi:putative transposase
MQSRKRLDHEIPDWVDNGAEFFLSLCAEPRGQNHFCHPDIGAALIKAVRLYNDRQRWYCEIAVLMPDHVHLLVNIPDENRVSRIVGIWKAGVARNHKISWQRNFFDHRLRGGESAEEKFQYILNNPVRAGLVEDPLKWPYVWIAGRD